MVSAAALLGMILLWDVENGRSQIGKHLYSQEYYIKADALMSIGLVTYGVRNESDPALALLSEYVNERKALFRVASIVELGIAYCGTRCEEAFGLLYFL